MVIDRDAHWFPRGDVWTEELAMKFVLYTIIIFPGNLRCLKFEPRYWESNVI